MLIQASVQQIRSGEVERAGAYIAICMRMYPRNLPKALRDEYLSCLAPEKELVGALKEKEKKIGHEKAFAAVQFEAKFQLGPQALAELERLASLSTSKKICLVCQCAIGEHCHREMLLIAARTIFGAQVGEIHHPYPAFRARLADIRQAAEKARI